MRKRLWFLILIIVVISLSTGINSNQKKPYIAIIDTGVDLGQKKLKKIVKKQYNAIDQSNNVEDDNGHGTLVASTVAEYTNYQINLVIIKSYSKDGSGQFENLERALEYSIQQKVDVILISSSFTYLPDSTRKIIQIADNNGIIIVAASGNNNSFVSYPAFYPEVLGIGASDGTDKAYYSNFGHGLDFIISDQLTNVIKSKYPAANVSGTSISSAIATGIISNIIRNQQKTIDSSNIRSYLLNMSDQTDSMSDRITWDYRKGFGQLKDNHKYDQLDEKYYKSNMIDTTIPFNVKIPILLESSIDMFVNVPYNCDIYIPVLNDSSISAVLFDEKGNRKFSNNNYFAVTEGRYRLQINSTEKNTPINFYIELVVRQDEYEDNDKFDSAKKTTNEIFATFHDISDTDFYIFQTEQTVNIRAVVKPIWGYSDLAIIIFDEKNNPIIEIDDRGINMLEEANVSLPKGTYYLNVQNKLSSSGAIYSLVRS